MLSDFDRIIERYGDLAVRVGLNLREGQRLFIIGPLTQGGVSLDAAPLVRAIAASAYRAGASLVETLWGDESVLLTRFRHARPEFLGEVSAWLAEALTAHTSAGGAVLTVYANDPDLLANEQADLVGTMQQALYRSVFPFRDAISRNETNWAVVAASHPRWAARVFPDLTGEQQVDALWRAIVRFCRLDTSDPIAAWQAHIAALAARRDYLNGKRFDALKYRGPGTDLTVGLPAGHLWVSARSVSRAGIEFTANLPTEEIFTMPHRDRVDGTVTATKPLAHGGSLIEGFSLTFAAGRVVDLHAAGGENVLRKIVDADEGAARLGEIALVPQNSPIAQSGVLFYNTLFDENAASHVALGSAYKFTMEGGAAMTADEFARAGGNISTMHVDFMVGSEKLDVDGIHADGRSEPLMRAGCWAF
jgi:aminopeptidase